MQVIEKKIEELQPYENNPRKNDAAVEYVANSIKEFGWQVPIVIDNNGIIVAGHTRYLAAMELGINTIPCVVAENLSEAQIRAFRLADNKVSEASSWDWLALADELSDLSIEFDMTSFGFDEFILDDERQMAETIDEFKEYDENTETKHVCPRCGYEWN